MKLFKLAPMSSPKSYNSMQHQDLELKLDLTVLSAVLAGPLPRHHHKQLSRQRINLPALPMPILCKPVTHGRGLRIHQVMEVEAEAVEEDRLTHGTASSDAEDLLEDLLEAEAAVEAVEATTARRKSLWNGITNAARHGQLTLQRLSRHRQVWWRLNEICRLE